MDRVFFAPRQASKQAQITNTTWSIFFIRSLVEAQPSLSPGSKDHQFSITRNRAGAGNLSVSIPFSLSDQKTNQSLKHVLPFRFPRQLFSLPQPTEKCSRVTKWQKQTISGPCHRNRVPSAAVAGVVLFRFGSVPRVAFKKLPSGGGPGLSGPFASSGFTFPFHAN